MKNNVKNHYRSCLRRKVAQEVIINLLTEQQAADKYNVSCILVRQWIRWYKRNYVEPHLTSMKSKKQMSDQERVKQLEKQLKSTQKALREVELKNKLLDTIIDIAEERFDFPVRKNPAWTGPLPSHHKSKPAATFCFC